VTQLKFQRYPLLMGFEFSQKKKRAGHADEIRVAGPAPRPLEGRNWMRGNVNGNLMPMHFGGE
jgi:hypothetical protein